VQNLRKNIGKARVNPYLKLFGKGNAAYYFSLAQGTQLRNWLVGKWKEKTFNVNEICLPTFLMVLCN